MKLTRLILGLAACAGLCACTNDEPAANGVAQETFDGDALYMVVKISDVGTSTRATEGGYQNGSAAEYAVTTADFYFYDAAGVFVSTAEVWNGGEAVSGNTNIEFEGNTVIVLKGLTSVGYPNYMVTVLNQPSDFIPGGTLTEMQTTLASNAAVGIMQGTNTYFTMSTSSYDNDLIAPFVTGLTADDFYEEPIDLDVVKPVQVYVERLAAKVQVAVSSSLTATTLNDDTIGYKLDETVAGDPNVQDDGSNTGDEDIYVKFLGWGLNGTAKYSNIVKNIDTTTWASGIDGWTGWSAPSDFRSFWGMSYNYGIQHEYPTTSNGASSSAGEGETLDSYLDYISYNDLTLAMGTGYDYCAENTNTVDVLGTKNSSGITNVLIAAELCDIDGNALDLVRYQGELFEKDALLAYALNEEKALGVTVNVYTMDDSTGEEVYSQIDDSYLTLGKSITASNGSIGPLYDGYVVVVADEDAFVDGTYYYNTGTVDTDGNPVFAAYDDVAAAIAAVNDVLYAFDEGKDMNAFTGGLMYYSVPIEHLNDTYGDTLLEANYGVVRNHWYSLSIDELINVGKGVFDPDEVIIPNQEDEKYYYVGAQINILSWKLVSQSVTL